MIVCSRKTGGLDIENSKGIGKGNAVILTVKGTCGIVNIVSLDTVYDLDSLLGGNAHLLGYILGCVHRDREALNIAVVGYRDRLMSPCVCHVDNVCGVYDGIHLRELRMQMQLDTLLGSVVAAAYALYLYYIGRMRA